MKPQKSPILLWADFNSFERLSAEQLEKFKKYEAFLSQKNQDFNLTAITDLSGIIRQHFSDSLILRNYMDLTTVVTIADVGTGAGFPAIPLKILFPHLKLVLIEVTKKKLQFLVELAELLELDQIEFYEHDWRTFLRTSTTPVDLFITRAALDDKELCRVFKPGCSYKNAQLVYWASAEWQPHPLAADFVRRQETYKLGSKTRKLVFLGLPPKV